MLEEYERKTEALRRALIEGENSGDAGELDWNELKRKARQKTTARKVERRRMK